MASSSCGLYHQSRRPSYDRGRKAQEQLLFGGATVSGPAAHEYLERATASEEEWRRSLSSKSDSDASRVTSDTTQTSTEAMHGYGDSWFENLNTLGMEYHKQKEARSAQGEATSAMHGYGDSWFENLNGQRVEHERRKSDELERGAHELHNYGTSWFEHYEPMWEDWRHVKTDARENDPHLVMDSDDESCEIGQ